MTKRTTDATSPAAGLRRSDPCWCHSGRKFKHCHLRREDEKGLPPQALNAKLIAGLRLEQCWHPQAGVTTCGPKIVRAHTLQRSSVLRRIADPENHVLTFCPPKYDWEGMPLPRAVGWKEASTFRGFCDTHDGSLFAPVETQPFLGSPEQCFLLAYRAACHELHQKRQMWDHVPTMQNLWDRGMSPAEQASVQAEQRLNMGSLGWTLIGLIRLKEEMDRALTAMQFDDWQFAVLTFTGAVEMASTGLVSPNVDFSGHQIQHDLLRNAQSLFYGMVIDDAGAKVAFAWLKREPAPRMFLDSMLSFGPARVPHLLAQFMFAYVENTFFSRAWWESRRQFVQEHIGKLALIRSPYMEHPTYAVKHVSSLILESAVFT